MDNTQSDNIIDALKNEGIQISREYAPIDELLKSGYRQLDGEVAARINDLFKHVAQFANSKLSYSAAQNTLQRAVEGTFRVRIDRGVHLGISHKEAGVFSANRFGTDGALKGPATLLPNNVITEIPKVTQYVSHAFNAASFVTGQYYMTLIDQHLQSIKKDTNELKRLNAIRQDSELVAAQKSLLDILNHRQFSSSRPLRAQADISEIRSIKSKTYELINQYQAQINEKRNGANPKKDKSPFITELIADIAKLTTQYQMAVQLLCTVLFTEILLENVTDVDELRVYKEEMENSVNGFLGDARNWQNWFSHYLEEASSINEIAFLPKPKTALSASLLRIGKLAPIAQTTLLLTNTYKWGADKIRAKKKHSIASLYDQLFSQLDSESELTKPIADLNDYISQLEKPIEFIIAGDSVYASAT